MKKNPHQINQEVLKLLQQQKTSYTQAELELMTQYEGGGGMAKYGGTFEQYGQGLLSEFFTPLSIVRKMVGLAWYHGYSGGKVLEPSCGTGRFLRFFDPKTNIDAFEVNPISFEIARHSFPNANIQQAYFESVFTDRKKSLPFKAQYELVIGNPPYGKFKGKYAPIETVSTSH